MSRSYKRTPWAGDTKGKAKKRDANSKVRMFLKNLEHEVQNGAYKRIYETWDICDYGWMQTWEEYWDFCLKHYAEHPERYRNPPNKKEEYRRWYKTYKMK